MSKTVKRGAVKDVDPNDVIDLLKAAGKIIKDLLKKDKKQGSNTKLIDFHHREDTKSCMLKVFLQ